MTLHRQARLQRRQSEAFAAGDARAGPRHFYELLDPAERSGFGLLPEPATGDVFFDMEGDPLFRPGRGLEYLFGVYAHDDDARPFRSFWAHSFVEERRAFEQFIDWVTARRAQYPAMHVYHFAPYEKTALRRLASQYATRENRLDALLRAEVFVDLFAVVRRAVRVSQPSYSLKKLEAFYDMQRATETKYGGDSIVMYEQWLREPGRREILDDIERYNQDDCRSTWMLREWLLGLRAEAIAAYGVEIPFRASKAEKAESATALDGERDEMRSALLQGLEDEDFDSIATRSDADRARWTLAHLLDYHRREENPVWWAFFDRQEQCDDFVHGDRESIGGLRLVAGVDPVRADRSAVYTYEFPEQQYKLKAGTVYDPETGRTAGTLLGIDDDANRLQLKRTGSPADAAAIRALIPPGPVVAGAQKASLVRIAQSLCAGTLERDHPVIIDLLLRRAPRVNGFERGAILQPEIVDAESLAKLIGALDRSYLFVQGPPGTGKTTSGAAAVVALLAAGKRVGIVANAYAAIANFLTKVERCAIERGVRFRGLQKFSDPDDAYVSPLDDPLVRATKDPAPFAASDWQLAAGNAWLFARPEMENALDVLVVDEAGQCALADALSVAPAARNIVLLGDPMQLAQVSIGTHPGRLGISVLEHLLGDGARTVAPDRGIFLNRSYRMRPEICEFISTRVYDGRLQWDPLTERQHVDGGAAALNAVPIEHAGNAEQSAEEADEIVRRIQSLLGTTFVDSHGVARPLSEADILVVTPYNAQRRRIARALQERDIHVAVGTVDKFQGQEAVAVFFSMATSSRDELRSGG
ncbi:MAG: TM0106 family RecB-like putative nuclease, partial [Candidatus Eremiobacteraeota bacterium]|nr:TM0106 family RecB-like putative nuclease [Candidatus Eremiobacteraeota bacterium]